MPKEPKTVPELLKNLQLIHKKNGELDKERIALEYCECLIRSHRRNSIKNKIAWHIAQFMVIVLAGLTPVLLIAKDDNNNKIIDDWLIAIPPALASIAASASAAFKWQENWILDKTTLEALESEFTNFLVCAPQIYVENEQEIDKDKKIGRFVTRINSLNFDHVKKWSTLVDEMERTKTEGTKTEGTQNQP